MNFEKEMQASLKVIFQNIQALDKGKKDSPPTKCHGRIVGFRRQHGESELAASFQGEWNMSKKTKST